MSWSRPPASLVYDTYDTWVSADCYERIRFAVALWVTRGPEVRRETLPGPIT
ncbi:MAG: hypothetical protein O7F17_10705 [Planctomycetota bacterium]|nr:hypothetical protein [Planctomycetota bacterium]MCZ6852098.1 hypothetical protein [Planctomycetota bacterium]